MMAATNQTALPSTPVHLGLGFKIVYGVGEIANAVKIATFALYSLFFTTAVLGLPGTWIGIAAFLAMFWDAAIDPCIGYLTDQKDSGSRRWKFMLAGALTMGVSYWAFFSPPHGLKKVGLIVWLMAASFVVRTATSMYSIPYYAVGASLTEDYNERTSIAGIRGATSLIGTALASSLSFILFFPERLAGVDAKLQPAGYRNMGLAFGALMTFVALISIGATRAMRGSSVLHRPPSLQPAGYFFSNMRESLRNHSFKILLLSFSFVIAGLAVSSSLLLHFLTYYVNIGGSVSLGSSQLALYSGGLLGTIFWLRISNRFDKHWLYVFSALSTAVLTLAALPLFGRGHLFGTGNVQPWLVGYGIAGFFCSVLWFIPQSMLADVADESELLTGTRREGVLFGMFSFGQQIAAGLALVLAGGLLDLFIGLRPGLLQQSSSTVYRIGVVFTLVPAGCFIIAAILMLGYRLTRVQTDLVQRELHRRRSAA